MNIADTPTAAGAAAILDGPINPNMMEPARVGRGPQPLSGDILRAYDNYQQRLADAGGVSNQFQIKTYVCIPVLSWLELLF